ncbi:MAG: sulfotransferase domain-containing protein [Flavobacteriales bacterium]|nr:sulfotransferase domain-containing protein [Flavobacteriales bacterium]
MVIGAMKCGTSALTRELSIHPDICFSSVKEPNLFLNENWRDLESEYIELFSDTDTKLLGEGSTSYTKLPHESPTYLVKNLYEYNPYLKFIYLMRDPIERIISHYKFDLLKGGTQLSFKESINSNPHLYKVGCYSYQLEPYINLFGRDNILLLTSEEFRKNRQETLNQISKFLNIGSTKFHDNQVITGESSLIPNQYVERIFLSNLASKFKNVIPVRYRYKIRYRISKFFSTEFKIPEIDNETRKTLREKYQREYENVVTLMGRELIEWKNFHT